MHSLKKLLFLLVALALLFAGLWLVIANPAQVSLDLLFLRTAGANLGLVVLSAFALGALVGVLVGLNLLELLRLRQRLFWLRREVRQLQDALGDRR